MAFLTVENVTKRFGGLIANRDISFVLEEGQIIGLIGPNGTGKTTLFNCLTGFLKAEEGKVYFNGHNTITYTPQKVLHIGIARTFQIAKTFQNMTVLENVTVGALHRHFRVKDAIEIAMGILEFTNLIGKKHILGGALTVPDRKRVELARALATQPKLLMLDEVMAGLNRSEIAEAIKMIKKIRDAGVTILIVEHIMEVVMPLSDRVLVMDQGALIAEGLPAKIVQNEEVIRAYLGENWDA